MFCLLFMKPELPSTLITIENLLNMFIEVHFKTKFTREQKIAHRLHFHFELKCLLNLI